MPSAEQVTLWRTPGQDAIELLHATYVTHTFGRHAHDGFAIGVIERGAERFHYRGAEHVAPAGSLVLIDPDEPHDGEAVTSAGWTYRMLYPDAAVLSRIAAAIAGRENALPAFPAPVVHDPEAAAILVRAHRALECGHGRLQADTLLLDALALLVERHAAVHSTSRRQGIQYGAIGRARDYLHGHHAQDLSLEEIAAVAGLSPFHFVRAFRAAVGLPPHAYLLRLRLAHARTLLAGGRPAADAALEAGFADQSHLSRRFKRAYGYTPAQYGRASKNVQDAST